MIQSTFKKGVRVKGVRPEIVFAVSGVVVPIYMDIGCPFVLTACTNGKHMRGSMHYDGFAVDIRVPSVAMPERYNEKDDLEMANCIRFALNGSLDRGDGEFDVVLEKDPLHIHIEFDPPLPIA